MKKINLLDANNLVNLGTGFHFDGLGLYLQVTKTGSKSWIFRYQFKGKEHQLGLGSLSLVRLSLARTMAKEHRLSLSKGIDPLQQRRDTVLAKEVERAKLITFDDCASQFIEAHRNGWSDAKHTAQWINTLKTYASPVFGHLPVSAIDLNMVESVLKPMWLTKTVTAKRLQGRIESVLGWATVKKLRQGDNPATWKGNLEHLLPAPNKVKDVKNQPALPWQEMQAFMVALRQQDSMSAKALEFTILTTSRTSETLNALWSEVDLANATWVIPKERMKARKAHIVPLSKAAMDVLQHMPRLQSDLIFQGASAKPLSDMTLTATIKRMHEAKLKSIGTGWIDPQQNRRITTHGFRSSFRQWGAEITHFEREVLEHCLAHKLPDKVEGAYQRGSMFAKRVKCMQAWSEYLEQSQPASAQVIPLYSKQ